MRRGIAAAGVVVLALVVIYLAAWQTRPAASAGSGAAAQAGTTTAVTSVTRTCPPPGPGTGTAHIAVVAAPDARQSAATGPRSTGSAALSAIPGSTGTGATKSPAPAVTITAAGALVLRDAPQASKYGATAVSATGMMAQGFEAEQATASGTGTVSCTHPGPDMWFVGTGVQTGAPTTRLYLMNTGAISASVEVTLITDAGVQPGLSTVITVAPGQYMVENLASSAPGSVVMAVHIQTSSGQVAADVWQGPSRGSGGAWLPQAAAPSTRVVIPGLTTASSAARLFIVVPGSTDAKVRIEALTAQGVFLPFGTAAQDAPEAASSSFALTSLGTSAAALMLTSNVPVTAAVAVPGSGGGGGSFTAAAAPVTGQGVVAGNPGGQQDSVQVILSAPSGAATATVSVIAASTARPGGQPAPRTVHVPSGETTSVTVTPPPGGQPFALVVTPAAGSGPLYAARVVTSGGGAAGPVVSILPVASAPSEVALPPARDSYTAILP
jgi:hypothetical protein